MPYELDDNEPLEGPTPEQPMKPATPETESRAAGNSEPINFVAASSIHAAQQALANEFRAMPDNVDALIVQATDATELTPGIIDLAVACTAGNTRYLSQLTSKCSVCGYEEVLELPQDASAEDMQLAMQEALLTPCPSCEEALQAQIERDVFFSFNELSDEDGEATVLD